MQEWQLNLLCIQVGFESYRFVSVPKEAKVFRSFRESEAADQAFYNSLTPEERLEILFELIARECPDESQRRVERVYRIVKLHEG